jgi:hypothetical protein
MNRYQRNKEAAREQAIEFQMTHWDHSYSWGELAELTNHFEKLGKRYGLLKEFKENGII